MKAVKRSGLSRFRCNTLPSQSARHQREPLHTDRSCDGIFLGSKLLLMHFHLRGL